MAIPDRPSDVRLIRRYMDFHEESKRRLNAYFNFYREIHNSYEEAMRRAREDLKKDIEKGRL